VGCVREFVGLILKTKYGGLGITTIDKGLTTLGLKTRVLSLRMHGIITKLGLRLSKSERLPSDAFKKIGQVYS